MIMKRLGGAGLFAMCCLQLATAQELDQQRFLDVKSAISQVADPIVVFGDSIVQGATLPASHCGHPLVNAGVTGAGIGYFQRHVLELLGTSRPALIVLAVGINDAAKGDDRNRVRSFRRMYEATLALVAKRAPVMLTTISSVQTGALASSYNPELVPKLNAVIKSIPGRVGIIDVTTPLSAQNYTSDGIHLKREGAELWTEAMLGGIGRALGCATR
jgi:lysophospholipase L1-like esterase